MTNKDIIKQYINKGSSIPEYQMNKLNNNLLKSYLRKRILICKNSDYTDIYLIKTYEWLKLSEEQKRYVIPYIYIDYELLDKDDLIFAVNLFIEYLLKTNHLPQFIVPDYEENQIYNIFDLFLEAYKKKNLNNINLIKKMMKVIKIHLPSNYSYDEYIIYMRYLSKNDKNNFIDYYIKNRIYNLDNNDIEELNAFKVN